MTSQQYDVLVLGRPARRSAFRQRNYVIHLTGRRCGAAADLGSLVWLSLGEVAGGFVGDLLYLDHGATTSASRPSPIAMRTYGSPRSGSTTPTPGSGFGS